MRFQSDSQRKAVMARMSLRSRVRSGVRSAAFRPKAEPYEGDPVKHPVLRGVGAGIATGLISRKVAKVAGLNQAKKLLQSRVLDLMEHNTGNFTPGKLVGVKALGYAVLGTAAGYGATSAMSRYLSRHDVQGKGRFKTPQEARTYRRVMAGTSFLGLPGALVGGLTARRRNRAELRNR